VGCAWRVLPTRNRNNARTSHQAMGGSATEDPNERHSGRGRLCDSRPALRTGGSPL